MNSVKSRAALLVALICLGACSYKPSNVISGDTPVEVARSIYLIADRLPHAERNQFSMAIATLTLTVPDRRLKTVRTSITPQLVTMIKGRTPDEVIQMAQLYRTSLPRYSSAELHPLKYEEERSSYSDEKSARDGPPD